MDAMADLAAKAIADSYKDTSRLAEIINDYNDTLELRWIPKAARTEAMDDIRPFVIVQNLPNGGENLVMYLSEQEIANPAGVLARLFNSDHSKGPKGAVLARIENAERAKKIWEAKKAEEDLLERLDFWKSVWKSPKHTYRHNGMKMDV